MLPINHITVSSVVGAGAESQEPWVFRMSLWNQCNGSISIKICFLFHFDDCEDEIDENAAPMATSPAVTPPKPMLTNERRNGVPASLPAPGLPASGVLRQARSGQSKRTIKRLRARRPFLSMRTARRNLLQSMSPNSAGG